MVTVRPFQAAVERVVTPDGEHNVWFVGDDTECAVIDPAGDFGDLAGHCEVRRLRAILWTTLWPESVGTALDLADRTGAATYLHTDDLVIWRQAERERRPYSSVPTGLVLRIGGVRLASIHTPGITAGALCWYAPSLSAVFTGRTLMADGGDGGDGGHGSERADRTMLAPERRSRLRASIRLGLFSLPSQTVVHPGRGVDTRIGTQRWDSRFWS
jgi:glyoxylase-like metal-dependent hydrolase (beta-lactamase superfamily II)